MWLQTCEYPERLISCAQDVRTAGQAVVQMARHRLEGKDYAIKFFVSNRAFESEAALYQDRVLGEFLPKVSFVRDDYNIFMNAYQLQ